MDLRIARAHYRDWLRTAGRSENTVRSVVQALSKLPEWASLEEIDSNLLGGALSRELAGASHNRYRQAWVSFFDWCVQRGYATSNPAKQLPIRKVIEQPNLILTPDQMLGMLDNANPVERIALALGMNTALRAGDVSALRVGDVNLDTLTLRTKIQKTGSYDEKPITSGLEKELWRWFESYASTQGMHRQDMRFPTGMPDDWRLVPSYSLVPVAYSAPASQVMITRPEQPMTHLHRLVQRALERQGLPTPGEGFHTLRRSAARALFEKLRTEGNYDHALLVVKEFLNHKSVEQTQRYLGINHERQIRDDILRGKDFLVASAPVCTAGVVDGINQRHGLAFDNPERIY